MSSNKNLRIQLTAVLNKLCKWRMVFAGWQLGTRSVDDPEAQALRDHRDATTVLRAEMSALIRVLMEQKVFTEAQYLAALLLEAQELDKMYEKRFPGFKSTATGMTMDTEIVSEIMKGWKP